MKDHNPSPITRQATGVAAKSSGEAEPTSPAFVPCKFYMTWTKTGRLPRFTSPDLAHAKREANRLARKNPGLTFIVMRGVEKIRYGEDDLDGEPYRHPDSIAKQKLAEVLRIIESAALTGRIDLGEAKFGYGELIRSALSHQPPRAPDEPGDRAREAGKSLPEGDA